MQSLIALKIGYEYINTNSLDLNGIDKVKIQKTVIIEALQSTLQENFKSRKNELGFADQTYMVTPLYFKLD
jgi:hypothetical protein